MEYLGLLDLYVECQPISLFSTTEEVLENITCWLEPCISSVCSLLSVKRGNAVIWKSYDFDGLFLNLNNHDLWFCFISYKYFITFQCCIWGEVSTSLFTTSKTPPHTNERSISSLPSVIYLAFNEFLYALTELRKETCLWRNACFFPLLHTLNVTRWAMKLLQLTKQHEQSVITVISCWLRSSFLNLLSLNRAGSVNMHSMIKRYIYKCINTNIGYRSHVVLISANW